MKFHILFVTSSDEVRQQVGVKKQTLFARDVRDKFPEIFRNCMVASVQVKQGELAEDVLIPYLSSYVVEPSAVVIIVEDLLSHGLGELGDSCFVCIYDNALGGGNIHNYFGRILSRLVKAFSYFSRVFDAEATRKMFLLPFRNFEAQELRDLRDVFVRGVDLVGFEDRIDQFAKKMRRRQKPKTTTNFNDQYYIDDSERYFSYGLERHAVPETSIPPHTHYCILNSFTRFGKSFDRRRHFNMSLAEGRITGSFPDCHGDTVHRKKVRHVNVFPSDHIA